MINIHCIYITINQISRQKSIFVWLSLGDRLIEREKYLLALHVKFGRTEKSKDFFSDKISAYRDEDTPNKGNPKNEALVACLENIKSSSVRTIFTDDINLFPDGDRTVWWEVWLRKDCKDDFLSVAEKLEIRTQKHTIEFPDREVLLALSDTAKLSQIIINTSTIAELRLAKDSPSVFFKMTALEQKDWVLEMSKRIEVIPSSNELAVCLLDYGVNRTRGTQFGSPVVLTRGGKTEARL